MLFLFYFQVSLVILQLKIFTDQNSKQNAINIFVSIRINNNHFQFSIQCLTSMILLHHQFCFEILLILIIIITTTTAGEGNNLGCKYALINFLLQKLHNIAIKIQNQQPRSY